MSDYDNTNTIAVWKNENDNPKAPVLKGNANVNGVEVKVSLWRNDSENPNAPVFKGKIELAGEGVPAGGVSDDTDFDF